MYPNQGEPTTTSKGVRNWLPGLIAGLIALPLFVGLAFLLLGQRADQPTAAVVSEAHNGFAAPEGGEGSGQNAATFLSFLTSRLRSQGGFRAGQCLHLDEQYQASFMEDLIPIESTFMQLVVPCSQEHFGQIIGVAAPEPGHTIDSVNLFMAETCESLAWQRFGRYSAEVSFGPMIIFPDTDAEALHRIYHEGMTGTGSVWGPRLTNEAEAEFSNLIVGGQWTLLCVGNVPDGVIPGNGVAAAEVTPGPAEAIPPSGNILDDPAQLHDHLVGLWSALGTDITEFGIYNFAFNADGTGEVESRLEMSDAFYGIMPYRWQLDGRVLTTDNYRPDCQWTILGTDSRYQSNDTLLMEQHCSGYWGEVTFEETWLRVG